MPRKIILLIFGLMLLTYQTIKAENIVYPEDLRAIVDVTKPPSEVYDQELAVLASRGFRVMEVIPLEPFDKAHILIIAQSQ